MFSMKLIDAFFIFFKVLCILATAFMVGFWLVKFKKDHDVTLIEYKAIEEFDEYVHPETSICFYNSFYRDKRFNVTLRKRFSERYIKYLKGMHKDVDAYNEIEYDQVSVDLFKHVKYIGIVWNANKMPPDYPCKNLKDCQFYHLKNNYNGFTNEGTFIKCFGIELNRTYAKDISSILLVFNKNLKKALTTSWMVSVFLNYPNQFNRPRAGPISIWQKRERKHFNNVTNVHFNNNEMIQITSIELLKRRNKRNEKCIAQWDRFDDLVLERHVEKVGCRAPYMSKFTEFPMCNTQHGLTKSKYFGWSLQKKYLKEMPPCQEMPNVDFKHSSLKIYDFNVYRLHIGFPLKGKIITQLQEVDAHSLIGNIGGYIGLFLGKF